MVRIIAAQVIILTVITLISQWKFLALFLAADFALRAFTYLPSPLATVAKATASSLGVTPKPVFAPPKRFAAALGFVFSFTILVLFYFHFFIAAYVVGGILITCAVLESGFKICIGCHVYNLIVAPVINKRNNYTG